MCCKAPILTHKPQEMKAPQRHWTGTQCTFHWPLPPDNTSATCPPQSAKQKQLDSDTHGEGRFDVNE